MKINFSIDFFWEILFFLLLFSKGIFLKFCIFFMKIIKKVFVIFLFFSVEYFLFLSVFRFFGIREENEDFLNL